jgi:serine/threonine-protein kinase RsbW
VVDSLCHDVIESHFDDPNEADFTLSGRERHGALCVRIEDEGLPYPIDHFTLDDQSLVGRRHAEQTADSLRVESRGVGGNALELTVGRSAHYQTALEAEADPGTAPVEDDAPTTIRALTEDDAPGLARCIYRCYGYTYANDFIYYPEQVLSLISRNLLRSFVAVTPSGEVVGHSGIVRDHPESRVAESGMAVVDPRYRSHHLLGKIKAHHSDAMSEFGLVGTYADAVAVHPITQKANVSIGAKETGLLLAEIPEFTEFRGFDEEPRQRGSVVMYYHAAGEAPEREVFVPERYRALMESIYGNLGLPRVLRSPTRREANHRSEVHVVVKGRRGLARIEVDRVGADLEEVMRQRFRELCLCRLDVIHVDLPLGDATAMATVDALCALGFFFGAIIPELRGGDILRLQYLNNVAIDTGRLVLYADEAKQMLEHILADRGS